MKSTEKNITKSLVGAVLAVVATIVSGFALADAGHVISNYCETGNSFFGIQLQVYAGCPIYLTIGLIFSITTAIVALLIYLKRTGNLF